MPKSNSILNLPGFVVKKATGFNPVIIEANYKRKVRCVHCNSKKLRKKSKYLRRIKHVTIGLRNTEIHIEAHKFYCNNCGKYFNQRFPGILKYQRATDKLKELVFHQHTKGVSQKDIACDFSIGKATVERWYNYRYMHHDKFLLNRTCPKVLGIDEHSFSRKHGFATTFCDLAKHKVFDVVKGRSAYDLKEYLQQLPGKDKVLVVCIDLSKPYRNIIKQYFPNAKIVADRFHVIRLLNYFVMKTYQSIDPGIKYQRGILNALRTNPNNLNHNQAIKLDAYFNIQPAIAAIYHFKQLIYRILMNKHRKLKQCKRLLPLFLSFIKKLKNSRFEYLVTFGKTLYYWREEIVRMWRFTKNNGITEGFHRKMKLIQRRAYGFKNFDNYRMRVRVLCS